MVLHSDVFDRRYRTEQSLGPCGILLDTGLRFPPTLRILTPALYDSYFSTIVKYFYLLRYAMSAASFNLQRGGYFSPFSSSYT